MGRSCVPTPLKPGVCVLRLLSASAVVLHVLLIITLIPQFPPSLAAPSAHRHAFPPLFRPPVCPWILDHARLSQAAYTRPPTHVHHLVSHPPRKVLVALLYSALGNQLSAAAAALVAAALTRRTLILDFDHPLPVETQPPGLLTQRNASDERRVQVGLAALGFGVAGQHWPPDRRPRAVPGRAALWNVDSPSELSKLALGDHPAANEGVLVATFGGRDLLAKAETKSQAFRTALSKLSGGIDPRARPGAVAVVDNAAGGVPGALAVEKPEKMKKQDVVKASAEWVAISGNIQACALSHLLHSPAPNAAEQAREAAADPAWAKGLVVAVHVRLGDAAFMLEGVSDDRRMPLAGMGLLWKEAEAAAADLAAEEGAALGDVRFFVAGDHPRVVKAAQEPLGSHRVLSVPGEIAIKLVDGVTKQENHPNHVLNSNDGVDGREGAAAVMGSASAKMLLDLLFLSRAAALVQTCTSFADKAALIGRPRRRVLCTWESVGDNGGSAAAGTCRRIGWAEVSKCR